MKRLVINIKSALSRWYILASIVAIIVLVIALLLGYYNKMFRSNVALAKDKYLFIKTGSNFNAVVDSIKKNSLVINLESFINTAKSLGYTEKVKPGCYKFQKGMSNRAIVRMLISSTQTPVKVTFNNVRTLDQLAGKVSHQLEIDSASFVMFCKALNTPESYGFKNESLVGMFIPNTYQFYWNTDVKGFFDRMKREYDKFWNKERLAKASAIGMNQVDVSTLASIVEEETNKHDEKARVAGVYINRLRINMPLQADPTVKFAIGDFSIRRVLTKHLEVKSPYNTYKNIGLPPGPINCPSISSIDAVLNYEQHQYLYFCAKEDFSGYHIFAKTLAEHSRNAQAYQKALNKEKIYR